jgi:hypothetical protein
VIRPIVEWISHWVYTSPSKATLGSSEYSNV